MRRTDILIVAMEEGRWGPARLPGALARAGLSIAALCPDRNALAASDHVAHRFRLPPTRSSRGLFRAVSDAIESCRPRLVIPADEQVVALLHAFVRQGLERGGADATLDTVVKSLGRPEMLDAMLHKSATLDLARRLSVRVPESATVSSAGEAARAVRRIGYPLYVKTSFSWAGQGVILCQDAAALATALRQPRSVWSAGKAVLRSWLGRDWYPGTPAVDIQKAIDGRPAMYCAVAWRGQMLAGFAGLPTATASPTGPSTSVRLCESPAMAAASARMIEAFGATGFLGFDFMIEDGTEQVYLLECNPRPIQVCHLGPLIHCDLAQRLATELAACQGAGERWSARGDIEVMLMPGSLRGDGTGTDHRHRDIPWDDRGLLRFAGHSGPDDGSEAQARRFI